MPERSVRCVNGCISLPEKVEDCVVGRSAGYGMGAVTGYVLY